MESSYTTKYKHFNTELFSQKSETFKYNLLLIVVCLHWCFFVFCIIYVLFKCIILVISVYIFVWKRWTDYGGLEVGLYPAWSPTIMITKPYFHFSPPLSLELRLYLQTLALPAFFKILPYHERIFGLALPLGNQYS